MHMCLHTNSLWTHGPGAQAQDLRHPWQVTSASLRSSPLRHVSKTVRPSGMLPSIQTPPAAQNVLEGMGSDPEGGAGIEEGEFVGPRMVKARWRQEGKQGRD